MSKTSKQVAIVVGASRGIGRHVAIELARNEYAGERTSTIWSNLLSNKYPIPVVVAAKTTSDASKCSPFPPDPNSSQSTINTVAREIQENGGEATAIQLDVRSFENIEDMVRQTVKKYGRIDVVVYNSGAIWWASVEKTDFKRFQLLQVCVARTATETRTIMADTASLATSVLIRRACMGLCRLCCRISTRTGRMERARGD